MWFVVVNRPSVTGAVLQSTANLGVRLVGENQLAVDIESCHILIFLQKKNIYLIFESLSEFSQDHDANFGILFSL